MRLERCVVVLAAVAITGTGCGYANGIVPQDSDAVESLLTATIDSVPFRADVSVTVELKNNEMILTGGSPFDRRISITLRGINAATTLPKQFRLTPHTIDTVGFATYSRPAGNGGFYYYNTFEGTGSGFVTVDIIDAEHVEASFSFIGTRPVGLSYDNVIIDNGHVYAKFKP